MFKKISQIAKKILIYAGMLLLLAPAGLLGATTNIEKAQAAEKTTSVKTSVKETPPVLETAKGLKSNQTYRAGEPVNLVLVFTSKLPLEVWADLSALDPTFPSRQPLKNLGDGVWRLQTSAMTDKLNIGHQTLAIFARNEGGTLRVDFDLFLAGRTVIDLKVKSALSAKEINLTWNPQKLAAKYVVQWGVQGERKTFFKVTPQTTMKLQNLQANTDYTIEISAFNTQGEKIAEKTLNLKTLETPVTTKARVAGLATGPTAPEAITPKAITPAIGGGVATRAPQVAQKPIETPSPTPQESQAPQEQQPRGWSRILVALAILIIAAGAAIGGYYGYVWYASRSHDEEPPASKSSNRW